MVDILIVVGLLFAAVVGYSRGLIGSLLGLIGNLVALAVAYFCSKPLALWLDDTFGVVATMSKQVQKLVPLPTDFSDMMASMDGVGQLYHYLERSFLSAEMRQSVLLSVHAQINSLDTSVFVTMGEIIAGVIATSIWQVVVFFLLWFVMGSMMALISAILRKLIGNIPILGKADRLVGAALGASLLALVVAVGGKILTLLGMMENAPLAQSVLIPLFRSFL